jgi:Fe-S-cluster-containing hydrogenase component 2
MKTITFETHNCGGCRTCELACSYHHTGVFQPATSSIKIISRPEQQGFAASFYMEPAQGHFSCDACSGLEEALCLKYCSLGKDELKDFLDQVIREINTSKNEVAHG